MRVAQQGHRKVVLNTLLGGRTSHQLIKNRQRITHRATAGTNHQLQHARLHRHLLLVAQGLQVRQKNLRRHQAERVVVGTRTNRAQHLIRLGRREDELHVLRRLLHNLQQGVKALAGDHVGLVNNENLVAVTHRRQGRALAQVTGVVHTAVARRVHLNHVEGTAAVTRKLTARIAYVARGGGRALRAVQAARQNTGRGGLTAAARSGEKVGVVDAVFLQGRHEGHGNLLLPDDLGEGLGAVTTIKGSAHGNLLSSGMRIGQSLPF